MASSDRPSGRRRGTPDSPGVTVQATQVQILPGTTARLIAQGPVGQGPDMQVSVLQIVGAGPVNFGGSQVNASVGLPYASGPLPWRMFLGQGDDLYAAAAASVMLAVIRNRAG